MPSTLLFVQSGGIGLVNSAIYSGFQIPVGGIQILNDDASPGPVFVGLPNMSGTAPTISSGVSLSVGGLNDAMKIAVGKDYFIPKTRLTSGVESIIILGPASSSGARIYWETF